MYRHPDVEKRTKEMPASSRYPWASKQGGVFKTLEDANDFASWREAYMNGKVI